MSKTFTTTKQGIHVLQDTFKFGEYSVMYMYGIYYIRIGTAVQM
jgi:hypothetical protein